MLDPPLDVDRDHILGPPDAEMTLVEYGSYACPRCHAVHEVIEGLRSRFGERMRYVFRHLPVASRENATRAAELAGVILAVLIPTRPPANLNALLAQSATVFRLEDSRKGEAMRTGPSELAMRILDAIHERIESPADKLLRSVEPWSSYVVLPIFALANAGVAWSLDVLEGREQLIGAITLGLVIGKPVGIALAGWLAVLSGIATKPDAYSWRQLCGAGALGGIGFTMSLFIAGVAFPDQADYAAAKIAIFLASLIAGGVGVLILWPKREANEE